MLIVSRAITIGLLVDDIRCNRVTKIHFPSTDLSSIYDRFLRPLRGFIGI